MNGTLINDDIARARALGVTLSITDAADRVTDPLPRDWPAVSIAEYRPAARLPVTKGVVYDVRGDAPQRAMGSACPTCEDGILTVEYSSRCRECIAQS